jgi:hypothetical protein
LGAKPFATKMIFIRNQNLKKFKFDLILKITDKRVNVNGRPSRRGATTFTRITMERMTLSIVILKRRH